jgi:hypothetical protein
VNCKIASQRTASFQSDVGSDTTAWETDADTSQSLSGKPGGFRGRSARGSEVQEAW